MCLCKNLDLVGAWRAWRAALPLPLQQHDAASLAILYPPLLHSRHIASRSRPL
jgi:hypothetical protein